MATVQSAVKARLDQYWTRCEVRFPNPSDPNLPNDGFTPLLVVTFPVGRANQITIGAPGENVFRDEGGIRFSLFVPRGFGTDPWDPWLEELRTLFRARQFDGVTTYAPSPAVIDDRETEGTHAPISFAVPYDADLIG